MKTEICSRRIALVAATAFFLTALFGSVSASAPGAQGNERLARCMILEQTDESATEGEKGEEEKGKKEDEEEPDC